jgi:hypothetical protein
MVPMTLGLAERVGDSELDADGDSEALGDSLDVSLGLSVLRDGSRADSLSDPPHPARTSVDQTIRVASRNIRRA